MKIEPSEKLKGISSYAFADVDNEVRKLKGLGITPIDFGVGDPKEPTPPIIRNYCKRAIDKRKSSGYPDYEGCLEYREKIAEWCKERFNIGLDPAKEIASIIGAKEAVFNFPQAFINRDDYVLIPNPGYPPYERGTIFAGGRTYFLPLKQENRFLPKLDAVPKDIIKRAKILWINYPNNPTGAIANKQFLKEAIDFGHDNNIIIASEECYSEIYFEEKPISILELSKEGIIAFQSLSKRSNMTTYRVGWVMGDENIIGIFKKLKTNIDSGTPTFVQDAAIAALSDERHVEIARQEYKKKRDIINNAFVSAGLEDCRPKATLYIWQRIPEHTTSVEFAKKLLQKDIAIVTTPGAWISKAVDNFNPGEGYIRLALVPSIVECKKAAERIRRMKL